MEAVRSLEKTLNDVYRNVPHLPKTFTQWLADNIWWLVIIGVVLSILSLLALIPLALFAFGLSASVATAYTTDVSSFQGAWLSVGLQLAVLIATTVIEAFAISPLKVKAKKGWTLLFIAALVNTVANIIISLVDFNIFGIVTGLLWAAVWGYVLFEIHGYFGAAHKVAAKKTAK